MMTLRDIGPAKLRSSEQAVTRLAADSLLFCADIVDDRSARAALSDFEAMREHLVATGRWNVRSACPVRRRRVGVRAGVRRGTARGLTV